MLRRLAPVACGSLRCALTKHMEQHAMSPQKILAVYCCQNQAFSGHLALPDHRGSQRSWPTICVFSTSTGQRAAGALQEFRLAQTGEGIKECELVQWFVKEGDVVEEFGRVCEVQSDKATIEITSPFAGIVKRLHHAPGELVQVGGLLADIHCEVGGADEPAAAAEPSGASRGEHAAGELPRFSSTQAKETAGSGSTASAHADRILTSPAVRALSRGMGIDLDRVPGTGPGGRITKGDVLAFADGLGLGVAAATPVAKAVSAAIPTTEEATVAAAGAAPQASAAAAAAHAAESTGQQGSRESVVVPLRGYRRAMVRSMTAAGAIPHFHMSDDVQVDLVAALRDRLRGASALQGSRLTYLPFFVKAAAVALAEFPLLNSSLSPDASSLLQHGHVNIGVAVATPQGLVVPNIKDVGGRSVSEIARELARLSEAANGNRLRPEDVSGGTFTISNIGTVGGTYASPLVNPPEVAIMALGRVQRLPRLGADGCGVVPAHIMGVSLGADHRVVDGAAMAGFARLWKQLVEDPGQLLLSLR